MFLSWYEKDVDVKGHIYFNKRIIEDDNNKRNHLPHFHNCMEFAFVTKGNFEIVVNDKVYDMHAGDVCYIGSFDRHRYHYEKGVECYVVLINRSFFNNVNGLSDIAFPTYMSNNEGFDKIVQFLAYSFSVWDSGSMSMKSGFVNMFSSLMKRYYPTVPKEQSEAKNEMMLDAFIYISEHSSENLTVESVARQFGYNKNYFSTLFNRFTGMNFREYLNACRLIDYNKLRHNHSELSVSTAASMCGFDSMNTFYRAYKKHFGDEVPQQ